MKRSLRNTLSLFLSVLLALSVSYLAMGSHNPFIYFTF